MKNQKPCGRRTFIVQSAKITAGISLLSAGLKIRASTETEPEDLAYCCYDCRPCPRLSTCGGCRSENPTAPFAQGCSVRICAIEKEIISCGLCIELATCDKSLWATYPSMREAALNYQSQWMTTPTEQVSGNSFSLYPNPVINNVTLYCPSGLPGEYRIFSLSGKMIKSGRISGTSCKIDVSDLSTGDYIFQFFSKRRVIYQEKFTKYQK